jgi:hypothetical protein
MSSESELLAADSADRFGPDHMTRAVRMAAARVSGCYSWCVARCCGTVKCHPECYLPISTALTTGRDTPDLHLRSGIAIIPPPRPAFVGGEGSPCEKKNGSLCEEES